MFGCRFVLVFGCVWAPKIEHSLLFWVCITVQGPMLNFWAFWVLRARPKQQVMLHFGVRNDVFLPFRAPKLGFAKTAPRADEIAESKQI